MRKLIVTLVVSGVAAATAVTASAGIPPIPSSCQANPFQVVCQFTTGNFVRTFWECRRVWVPGGPYACKPVRPIV